MTIFLKVIAGILIAVVLSLTISKEGKDLAVLLSIGVMCMIMTAGLKYLEPVIDFFHKLESTGKLNPQMFKILLKAVGIGLISEITSHICSDSGNQALGKGIHFAATAAILWLSIPLLDELLTLLETILGAI